MTKFDPHEHSSNQPIFGKPHVDTSTFERGRWTLPAEDAEAFRKWEANRRRAEREEREQTNKEKSYQTSGNSGKMASLLNLFKLTLPVTKLQLRQRYLTLMKENHPDRGGDAELAKIINNAYDELLPLLSS